MGSQRDVYPHLQALKDKLVEDRDYRIRCRDRGSVLTVVSPHGGFIEEGTSALARAIAGPNLNLFDFQGLRLERPAELHVTSTRFREPRLTKLLSASRAALSVHGMGNEDDMTLWLGGLNLSLKKRVERELEAAGFLVNSDSPRHRGESKSNFVNLVERKGVQLELPDNLIASMFVGERKFRVSGRCPKTTPRFDDFVKAIRRAVHEEMRVIRRDLSRKTA